MNAVGIDVSKGKSMVAIMRPFGEVVATPFEIKHTEIELKKWSASLRNFLAKHGLLWNTQASIGSLSLRHCMTQACGFLL